MIGLEHILHIYNMKKSEIADKLGVPRSNFTGWLKKDRNIPKERINQLSEIFPNIPKEYFQKELTKSEMLHVQEIYFRETDVWDEIEVPFTDDEGIERLGFQTISENEPIIRILHEEREKEELIERYERLLNEDGEFEYYNRKLIEKYINILEENNPINIKFLRMAFYYLRNESQWGFDPFFDASPKEIQMYEEFRDFLKKYSFITDG